MKKKFLVVCAANSFRSACGGRIFQKILDEGNIEAEVESCGVIPEILEGTMKVSPYAVTLMAKHSIDMSGHTPRHVSQVDLTKFDRIFAMDQKVHRALLDAGAPPEKTALLDAERGGVDDTWPHGKEQEHAECIWTLRRAFSDERRKIWLKAY